MSVGRNKETGRGTSELRTMVDTTSSDGAIWDALDVTLKEGVQIFRYIFFGRIKKFAGPSFENAF